MPETVNTKGVDKVLPPPPPPHPKINKVVSKYPRKYFDLFFL
jgi:hypothetical protein